MRSVSAPTGLTVTQLSTDGARKVSVVVPAFNAERFVASAVRSVLDQSYDRFEVIVVDDASTDGTVAEVRAMGDSRVRLLRLQNNCGVSAARNEGIRAAAGELLAFLDADDQCEPDRLSSQVAFLATNADIDVLGSAISVIDEDGVPLGYRAYPEADEAIRRRMPFANPLALSAVMARRAAVDRVGGFDPSIRAAEDYDLWCRMALDGCHFANLAQPLIRYRVHADASKTVALKAQLRATRTVKKQYWRETMSLAARARLLAEGGLLLAPSGLVMRAFVSMTYKHRLP